MTDKMKFIHLWELQLLTKFMLDDSPLEYLRRSIAIAEDDGPASPLNAVINQIASCKINGDYVFNVNASNTRIKITKAEHISMDCIREYLTEYAEHFEADEIVDYDPERIHDSYRTQYNKFIDSLNDKLTLKDYKIKSVYLPVILVGYFSDLVKINIYDLNLPLKKDYAEDNIPVIERFIEEDFDCPVLLQDFMAMNCKADISAFVKYTVKKTKEKQPKAHEIKFYKYENAVKNYVEGLRERGETIIYTDKLEEILAGKIAKNTAQAPLVTISKVVSELNTKYKKLHGKKLLGKKDIAFGTDGFYEIL